MKDKCQEYLQSAQDAVERGFIGEAINYMQDAHIEAATLGDPEDLERMKLVYRFIASEMLEKGHNDAAKGAYAALLEDDPNDITSMGAMVAIYKKEGGPDNILKSVKMLDRIRDAAEESTDENNLRFAGELLSMHYEEDSMLIFERLYRQTGNELYLFRMYMICKDLDPETDDVDGMRTILFKYKEEMPVAFQKAMVLRAMSKFSKVGSSDTIQSEKKIGKNAPCPCGSGVKFKKCCSKH